MREAGVEYWKESKDLKNRDGHYIRRSENIRSYLVSKSVDGLRNKEPKAPFMV